MLANLDKLESSVPIGPAIIMCNIKRRLHVEIVCLTVRLDRDWTLARRRVHQVGQLKLAVSDT